MDIDSRVQDVLDRITELEAENYFLSGVCAKLSAELVEADKLADALRNIVDWMEKAPFDYSNGNVSPDGAIDEGNFYGWRGHKEVVDNAKFILKLWDEMKGCEEDENNN